VGRLPETLALIALVLIATLIAAQQAALTATIDGDAVAGPFQEQQSLEYRRELATNPPALLRDLRTAGPSGFAFATLGMTLVAIAVVGLLRRGPRAGAAARGISLLALLLAVALATPIWASQPLGWTFLSAGWYGAQYTSVAPALALLRLGLAVAVAGHVAGVVLEFAAARRTSR
jgi:hypothetical protein